jgi:acetyltransferase-like isoleucine patch superfamily enzyme
MALFREPPHITFSRWAWRRLLSPLYSAWVRYAYGVELEDAPCWVGAALFRNRGTIKIGAQATLTSKSWANPIGNFRPCILDAALGAEIRIGHGFSASACCIIAAERVLIGNKVSLGANVSILDNDMHAIQIVGDGVRGGIEKGTARAIVIEDGVWIGAGATVLKGVRIGARSVIGAGVVLRHSVPADSVVVSEFPKCKPLPLSYATHVRT